MSPSAEKRFARPGSNPSRPTTIIRLTLGLACPRRMKTRTTALMGQRSTIPKAMRNVPRRISTLPAAAKPTPGPI